MGYSVTILKSAQREYESIVSYLSLTLGNRQAAKRFTAEFKREVDLVSVNPLIRGLSSIPEVAALGYRSCPVNQYVFLYKMKGSKVEVAHIFHQSQDYARLL